MSDDLRYVMALSRVNGVGLKTIKSLVASLGSAKAVMTESASALSKIEGIGDSIINSMMERQTALEKADRELEFMSRYGIRGLTYKDSDYPERLKRCDDGPVVLYVKGNVDYNRAKMISIVGTRKPSEEGKILCEKMVGELVAKCGEIVVVSGLAYGIDVSAHRAALKYGIPTIGVVAHGLDILYPSAHRNTAVQMLNKGSIVSEYMSGIRPEGPNFVNRNRIVAGMTQGTLVIESRVKGGSLITAHKAYEYGRGVMAVPGYPGMMGSEGCNGLIKQGVAQLVENADDIIKVLGWDVKSRKTETVIQPSLFGDSQSAEAQQIYRALLVANGLTASELSQVCGMEVSKVNVELFGMEMDGKVKSLPGGKYHLIS